MEEEADEKRRGARLRWPAGRRPPGHRSTPAAAIIASPSSASSPPLPCPQRRRRQERRAPLVPIVLVKIQWRGAEAINRRRGRRSSTRRWTRSCVSRSISSSPGTLSSSCAAPSGSCSRGRRRELRERPWRKAEVEDEPPRFILGMKRRSTRRRRATRWWTRPCASCSPIAPASRLSHHRRRLQPPLASPSFLTTRVVDAENESSGSGKAQSEPSLPSYIRLSTVVCIGFVCGLRCTERSTSCCSRWRVRGWSRWPRRFLPNMDSIISGSVHLLRRHRHSFCLVWLYCCQLVVLYIFC